MPVFRALVLLLLVASMVCFAMYVGTGLMRWRVLGVRILKWTVFAGIGFFAVLFVERLTSQ